MRVNLEKEDEGNTYKRLESKEASMTDLELKAAEWKLRKWRDAADGEENIYSVMRIIVQSVKYDLWFFASCRTGKGMTE